MGNLSIVALKWPVLYSEVSLYTTNQYSNEKVQGIITLFKYSQLVFHLMNDIIPSPFYHTENPGKMV